jgi:hypothetical protein
MQLTIEVVEDQWGKEDATASPHTDKILAWMQPDDSNHSKFRRLTPFSLQQGDRHCSLAPRGNRESFQRSLLVTDCLNMSWVVPGTRCQGGKGSISLSPMVEPMLRVKLNCAVRNEAEVQNRELQACGIPVGLAFEPVGLDDRVGENPRYSALADLQLREGPPTMTG